MQLLRWRYRPEGLRAPALICAFKGWNDAGDAASTAASFVADSFKAREFATVDPEELYDFQSVRPEVEYDGEQHRRLRWPEVTLSEVRVPRAPRDLIVLVGPEPSYHWRTFTDAVIDLAESLGVQIVVTLGALLADVPHTRPVAISGFTSDPMLTARLSLSESSYEGPTGILGVLQDACEQTNMPSASLWAAVPHYISASPNPKAALALIRTLEGLVGVVVDATALEQAAGDYDRQVNLAVQSDPEIAAFVERLERATHEQTPSNFELPSGDSIARDLQRFLRQRGGDGRSKP
jgi:predicted ATP-grasp superfamily ATP-dependent carboligase